MEPIIVLARHNAGNAIWENFEYLYVNARAWNRKHIDGNYPKHMPHAKLPAFEALFPSRGGLLH